MTGPTHRHERPPIITEACWGCPHGEKCVRDQGCQARWDSRAAAHVRDLRRAAGLRFRCKTCRQPAGHDCVNLKTGELLGRGLHETRDADAREAAGR